MAKWTLPEGRKPLTTVESADLVLRMHDKLAAGFSAGDRIAQLEAENKRLNEQMDAIEEMGTESLNALPDCLMRLAPALVENDELKAKLAKAVEAAIDTGASLAAAISLLERGGKKAAPSNKMFDQMMVDYRASLERTRNTLAELKGETDE